MVSRHHKQKIRRRRLRFLRIICGVTGAVFMFFGIGELFQGSSILSVALIGTAALLLYIAFSMRIHRSRH